MHWSIGASFFFHVHLPPKMKKYEHEHEPNCTPWPSNQTITSQDVPSQIWLDQMDKCWSFMRKENVKKPENYQFATMLHFENENVQLKGEQKKPHKSFDLFLCLNPRIRGRKWVLVDKIHFPSLLILWSKVKKQIENIENDVFIKKCQFWWS